MLHKLKTTILMMIIAITGVMAQSPNLINYQGVARNVSGDPLQNQLIRLRFKIRDLSSNGTVIYTEIKKVTTNENGLFNVQIGSGTPALGNLANIEWNNGSKYLQVEMDPAGGNAFVKMGTQQLVSVPYALYTNLAGALDPDAKINVSQINGNGATNGQVLKFNGTEWAPASINASGLPLPYTGVDSLPDPTFAIANNFNDATSHAIKGEANGGIGVMGTSNNVQGVYGSTFSPTYPGVFGYNYNQTSTAVGTGGRSYAGIGVLGQTIGSGTGVKGVSTGALSTATGVFGEATAGAGTGVQGMATNGSGVKGTASNGNGVYGASANNSGVYGSTAATSGTVAGVKGEANGSVGSGVWGVANFATGYGVQGSSTNGVGVYGVSSPTISTGAAIRGENNGNGGSGILGIANFIAGYGVQGSSTTGTGIYGYSNSNKGVLGSTISGTALYGNSITGYGLESYGKVKIAGGNTNPGTGKVLTSDANGNATWENPQSTPRVAFRVRDINPGNTSFPDDTPQKVEYATEEYDLSNNFTPSTGTANGSTGTFVVPAPGIYHFDAQVDLTWNVLFDVTNTYLDLMVTRNGNTSVLATNHTQPMTQFPDNTSLHTDVKLLTGDIVWIRFEQLNYSVTASDLDTGGSQNFFSGHLVFTDF